MRMKCNTLIILINLVCSSSAFNNANGNVSRAIELVIEEEDNHEDHADLQETSGHQEMLCSAGTSCIPLSKCTIMSQLLKSSCLQSDKLGDLRCGYTATETLICCPKTCPSGGAPLKCGQPKLHNWWPSYTGLGSQPWAVRVGFRNKYSNKLDYFCSGSILNKRTVLTAAHCALAKSASHKISSVLVGEYHCDMEPDCTSTYCAHPAVNIPLSHIIVHPGFDQKTFRHNIALLFLRTPMNFSLAAQPICLYPRNKNEDYIGLRGRLVGWGRLATQTESQPYQQQLAVPILPIQRCSAVYGGSVPITQDELCVGGEPGKDACNGFGGAPLVILDPQDRDRYYQIGLVSFGSDQCGAAGVPSVYTRVDRYTDWIQKNTDV